METSLVPKHSTRHADDLLSESAFIVPGSCQFLVRMLNKLPGMDLLCHCCESIAAATLPGRECFVWGIPEIGFP